jgi:hypothetical protein
MNAITAESKRKNYICALRVYTSFAPISRYSFPVILLIILFCFISQLTKIMVQGLS